MRLCISDRFVSYSINLVTNDRVHLPCFANHRNSCVERSGDDSTFGRSPKCGREFILDDCGGTQRIQGSTSLRRCLPEPDRQLFQGAPHATDVRWLFQSVVGDQLATLHGLKKSIMKIPGNAGSFCQPFIESLTHGDGDSPKSPTMEQPHRE